MPDGRPETIVELVFLSKITVLVNMMQIIFFHNRYPRRIIRKGNTYMQRYSVKGNQGNSNKPDLRKWRLSYKKDEKDKSVSRRERYEEWYELTQLNLELSSAFLEEGLLTREELDDYNKTRREALINALNFKAPGPHKDIYTPPRRPPNSNCCR